MSGTTPNIGLNVPAHGDKNWDVPVNQNWNTLDTAIAGKQATLTFDSTPTSGSSNPVTSDGIYTGLGTKVNITDLSTVYVVTETYVSGTSWYRVWSDGWIEQGGRCSAGNPVTITYLKQFKDLNYGLWLFEYNNTVVGRDASRNTSATIAKMTKNNTQLYVNTNQNGAFWYACGYGA